MVSDGTMSRFLAAIERACRDLRCRPCDGRERTDSALSPAAVRARKWHRDSPRRGIDPGGGVVMPALRDRSLVYNLAVRFRPWDSLDRSNSSGRKACTV